MATCVKCKKEIDSTLKYCPHCGAKQNMYIDVNQVVTKNLIDEDKFDANKDVLKTPKVQIIIDDSEAAKPNLKETKEEVPVKMVEELPTPNIRSADISEYENDIDIVVPNDVGERMNKVSKDEIVATPLEEEKVTKKSQEEIKSKRINVFNIIFNLFMNIACIAGVGIGYFYATEDRMLALKIASKVKHNLTNIAHLSFYDYASILGLVSLGLALLFLLAYITTIFMNIKDSHKKNTSNYWFGLSMTFVMSTLFFNSIIGNYFIYALPFAAMGLIIASLIINAICRCKDPLALYFRWGFRRYYLENKENLPKLSGTNSSIIRRKVAYIIITILLFVSIVCEFIFTEYRISVSPEGFNDNLSLYSNYFSQYVNYKGSFDVPGNIFKIARPTLELLYINGYGGYTASLFVLMILIYICVIANEFISKRKEAVISRIPSLLYVFVLIALVFLVTRSVFVSISIFDKTPVISDVPQLVLYSIIAQAASYILCFLIMILDRGLNKNIIRKQMAAYREM